MDAPKHLEIFCKQALKKGALDAIVISPQKVFTATWVRLRCQYGCSEYGQCLTCPPYSPTPETTRKMLDEYQSAILLHGNQWEPLREIARDLELKIFLAGYYKAFAFICGPCWMCKQCVAIKSKERHLPASIPTWPGRLWRPRASTSSPPHGPRDCP